MLEISSYFWYKTKNFLLWKFFKYKISFPDMKYSMYFLIRK